MDFLRLLIIFGVGFVTWWLALARTLALINQQRLLVCSFIFIEETLLLWAGIWLARYGGISEVFACALGGVTASYIVMRNKHGSGSRS